MGKYLKKFENHSNYETFTQSVQYLLPNVSVCLEEDERHFNPYDESVIDRTLTFVSEESNSTISFDYESSQSTIETPSLQYSIDNGNTWNSYTIGTTITLSNIGDSVKFKGTNGAFGSEDVYGTYYHFVMTGTIAAYGDITSLFNEIGGDCVMPNYACCSMFYECTSLTKAPNLPSTVLGAYCYANLFDTCGSLTETPEFPATSLSAYCYSQMFYYCDSLEIAHELPSTEVYTRCYQNMFEGCTALTTAPLILPSETLSNHCYLSMFKGCSSLTTAPILPATTLVEGCYNGMFQNCYSLNYIKAMFTTTPNNTQTNLWVKNVSLSGTFVKNSIATWNVNGINGIPNGWTVETASS